MTSIPIPHDGIEMKDKSPSIGLFSWLLLSSEPSARSEKAVGCRTIHYMRSIEAQKALASNPLKKGTSNSVPFPVPPLQMG